MLKFTDIKSINPKLKQSEIAKEFRITPSTLQRYRRQTDTLPPYRKLTLSNINHTRKQKTLNTNIDEVKMTSNEIKMT